MRVVLGILKFVESIEMCRVLQRLLKVDERRTKMKKDKVNALCRQNQLVGDMLKI